MEPLGSATHTPPSLGNIKQGLKYLPVTNDLAYLTGAPVRGLKCLNNQDSQYYKDF